MNKPKIFLVAHKSELDMLPADLRRRMVTATIPKTLSYELVGRDYNPANRLHSNSAITDKDIVLVVDNTDKACIFLPNGMTVFGSKISTHVIAQLRDYIEAYGRVTEDFISVWDDVEFGHHSLMWCGNSLWLDGVYWLPLAVANYVGRTPFALRVAHSDGTSKIFTVTNVTETDGKFRMEGVLEDGSIVEAEYKDLNSPIFTPGFFDVVHEKTTLTPIGAS